MISLFRNKKIKAFGLDISDTSIKVMEIEKVRQELKPQAFSNELLSDKVINNHMIVNPERLADNIKRAINAAQKIDTKYVVCSIPEAKSFVRTVTIPKMSEVEIDGAIPYELEQDIPIPVDQVYLDWQVLRDVQDKMELLVTAAPKDYIDLLVESLHLAGLKPVAFELESQAIARALIGPEDMAKTVLIADLATAQTSFIIINRGVTEYTSSVAVAGNAFTESIVRSLGVSKSEAEKIKRAAGLTNETRQGNIRSAILPILDNIVDEIKNVVRFFEEHDAEHKTIETILICGGSAQLVGIADYISARINLGAKTQPIRVMLGQPWLDSGLKKDEVLPYTTVFGLALRGVTYES